MDNPGGKKPAGQRHMTKKSKGATGRFRRTMGTGSSKRGIKGAMGKHQQTGDGGASN